MTTAFGLTADLSRLADLLTGRMLPGLPDADRLTLAGLQTGLILARHDAGLYAESPEPLPARGREIAASPWN